MPARLAKVNPKPTNNMCMTQDPTTGMPAVINGKAVINKQEVFDIINSLASSSHPGSVTTLEVKNKLRADGKFATQDMVSYFMGQVYQELQGTPDELSRSSNGSYFTYSWNDSSTNAAVALLAGFPSAQSSAPLMLNAVNASAGDSTSASRDMLSSVTAAITSYGRVKRKDRTLSAHLFRSTPLVVNPNTVDLAVADTRDWYARSKEGGLHSAIYDKSLTRDQVRASYARGNSSRRNDALACRLANLSRY